MRRNAGFISSNPFGAGFIGTALTGIGGGGIAYAADRYLLNKIGRNAAGADTSTNSPWFRNAARVVAGGVAAYFFRGNLGAAINGGLGYPLWGSVAELMTAPATGGTAATSAYLSGTDAYLSDVLDGMF